MCSLSAATHFTRLTPARPSLSPPCQSTYRQLRALYTTEESDESNKVAFHQASQDTEVIGLFVCGVSVVTCLITASLTCVDQHPHPPSPTDWPAGTYKQASSGGEGSHTHPSQTKTNTQIKALGLTKQLSMEQDTLPARLMSRRGRAVPE